LALEHNIIGTLDTSYLKLLQDNPPTAPYVSRGNRKDIIDIAEPHLHIDKELLSLVSIVADEGESQFMSITGGAGMGKTHLYWALKSLGNRQSSMPYRCIYTPPPSSSSRIGIQVYTPLIQEMGASYFVLCVKYAFAKAGLRDIASMYLNYPEYISRLRTAFPEISLDPLSVLARFGTDSKLRPLAMRWLLGHYLHAEDREKLGVDKCLDDERTALDTICLLLESSAVPVVFYLDEMETPFRTLDENGQEKFLSFIHSLVKESQNTVVICACLDQIWSKIESTIFPSESDISVSSVKLTPFTADHLREYIERFMSAYWMNQGVDIPHNELIPFSNADVIDMFRVSNGNPRKAIRLVHQVLEMKLSRVR
jgi:hypothetical protein